MKKVVMVPLDERPCNFDYGYKIFHNEEFQILRPEELGDKKKPADMEKLFTFLENACKMSDALVISIDTLLYGGLIPSRLHPMEYEVVNQRLHVLEEIRRSNQKLKIYAFQCIMRCPQYSSSDEEPDYYGEFGKEIFQIGRLTHLTEIETDSTKRNMLIRELDELKEKVPAEYIKDYIARRKFNIEYNIKTLQLVKQGIIDFLIIPQDDSALYGFTAMDQREVRREISKELLYDKVLMYPGADEVGMTLLSRVLNNLMGKEPKVYVKYASLLAPLLVPKFEDRSLGETIKYQLMAAGCLMVDQLENADFILAVNAPANEMLEATDQPALNRSYDVERNLTEYFEFIKRCITNNKPITICDNAYVNGGEIELIRLLNQNGILLEVAGYAGWNTSSNTMGTAIAEAVSCFYFGKTKKHLNFLIERYLEDVGYDSIIRWEVNNNYLPERGLNFVDLKGNETEVAEIIKSKLEQFAKQFLSSISDEIYIEHLYMPWRRMFEIGISAKLLSNDEDMTDIDKLGLLNKKIQSMRGRLIVSCQALPEEPLHSSFIMGRMAVAAKEGGASGIRSNTREDIQQIKSQVDLPVIGIVKRDYKDSVVYITPTIKEVEELMEVEPEIIAMDATGATRPNHTSLEELFREIKKKYPDQLLMADCSTVEEAIFADQLGFDFIGTTLVGYTEQSKNHRIEKDDFAILKEIIAKVKHPVIAEGNINTPDKARRVIELGAYSVVVGAAITRPQLITKTFVDEMMKAKME